MNFFRMNIPKSYVIETENLLLQIPTEADFPHVFSATRLEGFNDGMLWDPPEDETELVQPLLNNIKSWEEGTGFAFTIRSKETHDFLGRISIRKTDEEYLWNVGFWTHPRVQSKGIMTEALNGILRFGFETLGAKRIEACYATWNKASERVLDKNGMRFVRFIEKGFQKKGKWVAENLMEISLEDWNAKK